MELWTQGFYRLSSALQTDLLKFTENIDLYGIDPDGPTPELETDNNVQVPTVDIQSWS